MRRREAPRRLTGPSVFLPRPGAVLDVSFEPDENAALIIDLWQQEARQLLDGLGWLTETTAVRRLSAGASLAVSAPVDGLYTATEIVEWAWENAIDRYHETDPPPLAAALEKLRSWWAEEQDEGLQQLAKLAQKRGIPCLIDGEQVTLGSGRGAQSWPRQGIPRETQVAWASLSAIPTVLVTGTNGKTTSTRLLAAMARAAGFRTGYTCTDGIVFDETVLESGDCAGPGGARVLLRHRELEWAILEVARGGLLRRGLPIARANAALITNVAADHLGDFGVTTLDELAEIKGSVRVALSAEDYLILNADDPRLMALGRQHPGQVAWFSADERHPSLRVHREAGGLAAALSQNRLMIWERGECHELIAVEDMPITLNGRALFNAINGLGAALTGYTMGLPLDAIRKGLRHFLPQHNGARGQLLTLNGVNLLVDFAHNPHGMAEIVSFCKRLPRPAGQRRLLLIGQAGDRDNQALAEFAQVSWGLQPNVIYIKELAEYRRGRRVGEVAAQLRAAFERCGADPYCIEYRETELEAVQHALLWAMPGDLLILLIHAHRQPILDWLLEQGAENGVL